MTEKRYFEITRFHNAECGCDQGLTCYKAKRIAKHYDAGFDEAKNAVKKKT